MSRGIAFVVVAAASLILAACEDAAPQPSAEIAFTRSRGREMEIFMLRLPTREVRQVTSGPGTRSSPTWAPGGDELAYAYRPWQEYSIWRSRADGSDAVQLTRGIAIDGSPAWAPDGSLIAFASNRQGGAFRIWTVSPEGEQLRRRAKGISPTWSPNSASIAFSVGGRLAYVNVATGEVMPLTDGAMEDGSPAWSPSGDHIAFARRDPTGDVPAGIFLYNLADAQVQRLTDGIDDHPAWSPDGERIVFSRQEGSGAALFVIDADSENLSQVTDGQYSDVTPAWSPDRETETSSR